MHLPNIFGKPKAFDVLPVKYMKPIDEQLVNKVKGYLELSYKYLSKMGLSKTMIGIFETNSLIAAALLKPGENVVAMVFDFGTDWYTDSLVKFCNTLSLNTYILKRGSAYQEEMSIYGKNPEHYNRFASCNVTHYKRFINYHLLIAADQMKAALLDTADKSDRLLGLRPEGFYGHFMPFYSLYKSELYDLAKFLGLSAELIGNPTHYQDLLYPDRIPLSWDQIDPILYLLTEKQLTPEEISKAHNIDLHWLKRLKSRIDKQQFKTTISQLII